MTNTLSLFEGVLKGNDDRWEIPTQQEEWPRGNVIAHLLPDVPEEIIHAAGFVPLPVLSSDHRFSISEGHLPSFLCPLVKGPFEMALNKSLDFIKGMAIPYVCDSTRAFSQVWESYHPHLFNHTLWLPKKCDPRSVRPFLIAEFNRLKQGLERLSGRQINDDRLRQSIALYNLNRGFLRKLFQLARAPNSPVTYSGFLSLVKTTMMLPREKGNEALAGLLEMIRTQTCTRKERSKVFLFGMLCDSSKFLDMVAQAGLQVVDDNLYNGTRHFLQDASESIDPIEALVDRHLSKDPLGVYLFSREQWSDYLLKRMGQRGVQGVIYLYPRYCDPMEFDFPFLRGELHSMGIPVLSLELDFPSISEAQMRTRLEAFSEMLKGGL